MKPQSDFVPIKVTIEEKTRFLEDLRLKKAGINPQAIRDIESVFEVFNRLANRLCWLEGFLACMLLDLREKSK